AAAGAAAARRELLLQSGFAAIGIVLLLALAFRDARSVMLILAMTPFALVGGVLAVAVTGATLSIGSLVGFVTLFGIVARNAILLLAHVEHLIGLEGADWSLATVLRGARERLVPILMTALVTALGLLPLAAGSGEAGREVQGPMASVILGGLATSTVMTLLVLPVLVWRFGPLGAAAADRRR
ncbi:MAG TPA: efflux RND transporter permease subunit, partial [Steroidobacteraceae bacterium]|nr:efflux RND transporter permease subunit [Steroidobacteraceae bacterium]